MENKRQRLIILLLFLVLVWAERRILGPFLLAAVVAYVLNPLINLLHHKFKIPRLASILFIYVIFITAVGFSFLTLTSRLFEEIKELTQESSPLINAAGLQISNYPDWAKSLVDESFRSLRNATVIMPTKILPFFTGAVSQLINIILFLSTAFYLLKDSQKVKGQLKKIILEALGNDAEPILEKIFSNFSLFLRGQLFLVLLMASLTFLVLSFLNVKFALILAIFTGFAEIVPIVGPILATTIATIVTVTDGRGFLGLDPVGQGTLIIGIYFILRQLEDIIVIPQVMGKIARVHPLIIMFAVLAGGHLAGFWGLFMAVPVLSTLKILLEYYW